MTLPTTRTRTNALSPEFLSTRVIGSMIMHRADDDAGGDDADAPQRQPAS
ncbi:hypothetical protein [Bradyrhizobium sp. SZCCHNR2028]|nr:hypothetical protein [Bradyrhizobium sp. SZCCHNR2028]